MKSTVKIAKKLRYDFDDKGAYLRLPIVIAQFMRKIEFHPNGHWLWRAGLDKDGYGKWQIVGSRKKTSVHRFAYEWFVGPIPPGLEIDHTCEIRNCCNPEHLEPVTSKQNTLRRIQRRKRYARTSPIL